MGCVPRDISRGRRQSVSVSLPPYWRIAFAHGSLDLNNRVGMATRPMAEGNTGVVLGARRVRPARELRGGDREVSNPHPAGLGDSVSPLRPAIAPTARASEWFPARLERQPWKIIENKKRRAGIYSGTTSFDIGRPPRRTKSPEGPDLFSAVYEERRPSQ